MARTPTDTANDRETPTKGRGAYLPVLPEGWAYRVAVDGPDGNLEVRPREDGSYRVTVATRRMDGKEYDRPNLADALRSAVKSIKALSKLARHEADAQAARTALLAELGDNDKPGTDPGPVDPAPVPRESSRTAHGSSHTPAGDE